MRSDEMQQNNMNRALDDQIHLHPWNLPVHVPVRFLSPMRLQLYPQHNLFPTKNQENIKSIIKSWSNKCTLFINCYLIQSILKIVQHVSNYVTVHLQGIICLLHQLYMYGTY
jgi:hypothetical protein